MDALAPIRERLPSLYGILYNAQSPPVAHGGSGRLRRRLYAIGRARRTARMARAVNALNLGEDRNDLRSPARSDAVA